MSIPFHQGCRVCGGQLEEFAHVAHDRLTGRAVEGTYWRCLACGGMQLHPLPVKDVLANSYGSDYYAYELTPISRRLQIALRGAGSRKRSFANAWLSALLSRKRDFILLAAHLRKQGRPLRLLDFGGGAGA